MNAGVPAVTYPSSLKAIPLLAALIVAAQPAQAQPQPVATFVFPAGAQRGVWRSPHHPAAAASPPVYAMTWAIATPPYVTPVTRYVCAPAWLLTRMAVCVGPAVCVNEPELAM